MATDASGGWRGPGIWALRIVLGIAFAYIGTTKLTGTGNTVEWFAAIGWGQWFRYVSGSVDLVGAVLLFVSFWTCYGAMAIACSVGLGTLLSLTVLHGNPTWSFYYRNLVHALRGNYRTIVPDHIGCGLSDKPDDAHYSYSLDQRVQDLERLLDHLDIRKNITFVLHDWGGMIGMAYASRNGISEKAKTASTPRCSSRRQE